MHARMGFGRSIRAACMEAAAGLRRHRGAFARRRHRAEHGGVQHRQRHLSPVDTRSARAGSRRRDRHAGHVRDLPGPARQRAHARRRRGVATGLRPAALPRRRAAAGHPPCPTNYFAVLGVRPGEDVSSTQHPACARWRTPKWSWTSSSGATPSAATRRPSVRPS